MTNRIRLRQKVIFMPGFDERDSDPSKNYGINGGSLMFGVCGSKGATTFTIGTTFFPESARKHLIKHSMNSGGLYALDRSLKPMGYDVGFHSLVPLEYNVQAVDKCVWLNNRKCYCDGSGLRATEWLEIFLEKGTDWLWPELKKEYMLRFINITEDNHMRVFKKNGES